MKKRTRARELALQFLYQIDVLKDGVIDELDAFLRQEERDAETCRFARRITVGTHERRETIDGIIQGVAQNWQISRMAVIDRNVLRLAAFELLYCDDIPPKVAINEAIDRHLQSDDFQAVIVAADAAGLQQALESEAPSPMDYANPVSQEVTDTDPAIEAIRVQVDSLTIVPVEQLFE